MTVWLGDLLDQGRARIGIGEHVRPATPLIAVGLDGSRSGDPCRYFCRPLAWRWQNEIGGRHRRKIDAQVDAVHQWAGNPGLIVRRAVRALSAGLTGFAGVPASTRVHCRDQLKARGIADAVVGPRDHCFAGLKR